MYYFQCVKQLFMQFVYINSFPLMTTVGDSTHFTDEEIKFLLS